MGVGTVAVAVLDDHDIALWDLYEVSIPSLIFGISHKDLADPWYEFRLCAENPTAPRATMGFVLNTPYSFDDLCGADTVIVPGVSEACVEGTAEISPALIQALGKAHKAGARIVSLCTGAFALAAAGLLDGRRATAHWMHTDLLAQRYPQVLVDDAVLYVDNGDVLTSAGICAGIDLCLHLVRNDLGAHVANQLARRLVIAPHRSGGQAQFITLSVPMTDDAGLAPVLQWAQENLDQPLTVDDLARRAGMATRTFHRKLHAATGTTPLQWLLNQRLARAQALLELTHLPIEQISERSGLGAANNLRRHFTAHVGVSPSDYRRMFQYSRHDRDS